MTENKRTIQAYLEGFRKSDHAQILSCLTEEIEWEMPGVFHHVGKAAFDKEIENNAVIAEGAVQAKKRDGALFNAVFCDVFLMKHGKIDRLTTYLMEVKS